MNCVQQPFIMPAKYPASVLFYQNIHQRSHLSYNMIDKVVETSFCTIKNRNMENMSTGFLAFLGLPTNNTSASLFNPTPSGIYSIT